MKVVGPLVVSVGLTLCAPAHGSSYAYAELDASGAISTGTEGDTVPDALYEAGSIGKFACTLAVLKLADRGAFTLDDSLGELLPEASGTPIARITLRQVLASRSGIADGLLPAFQSDPQQVMATPDARTAVRRYTLDELAAEPGETWSYDLVNWVVVQAVIEHSTGLPVAQVLEQMVLQPAGMGQSRMFVGEIGEAAHPPAEPSRPIPGFLTCAGGLATTPTDLIALARFPHHGGLSAASVRALMTITTPEEGYTLGGRYQLAGEQNLISWQTGSNGAYKSLVVYDPTSDTGFAAITASGSNKAIQSARAEWLAEMVKL